MLRPTIPRVALMLALALAGASLSGCALRAPFSPYSFEETARLKTESIALVEASGRSYAQHYREAEALLANVYRAYKDSRLRTLNEESMRVWLTLLDANQPSLAGALNRWKLLDTLAAAERATFLVTIERDFDAISTLEGKKKR